MDLIQPCGKSITLLHIKSVDCVTRHHTVFYSWTIRSTVINRLRWWVPQEKLDILLILQLSQKVQMGENCSIKIISLRNEGNTKQTRMLRKRVFIVAFRHHKTTQECLLPKNSQSTTQSDKTHIMDLYHMNNFEESSERFFVHS